MHVCYTCTRPATQPLLPQGQKTSLPFPCLIKHTCLKPRLQASSYINVTALRDYQACCSTHVFKRCSETACIFVTVAPGHLAHRIQACISVTFANTFVVVGLCQQVCLLHLPQTGSYVFYVCTRPRAVKHNCTRPSDMYVTVAPDQQSCLYMLHTISMHVSYSFILSTSMIVIFSPGHQPSVTIASDHLSCL